MHVNKVREVLKKAKKRSISRATAYRRLALIKSLGLPKTPQSLSWLCQIEKTTNNLSAAAYGLRKLQKVVVPIRTVQQLTDFIESNTQPPHKKTIRRWLDKAGIRHGAIDASAVNMVLIQYGIYTLKKDKYNGINY